MKSIIFIFSFVLLSNAFAKEEIIRSFIVSKSNTNLQKIADQFEIKSKLSESFLIYVLKEDTKSFQKLAPKAQLISEDINYDLKKTSSFVKSYRTYKNVREDINGFLGQYPKLTSLSVYGKSKDNNPLFALKITNSLSKINNKKKIMLTSATHGDELITVEVLFGLMERLLEKSKDEERFKSILDHTEIFFIPVVNPDGYKSRSRYSHRVDPNRAYPMPNGRRRTKKHVKAIDNLMAFYNKIDFDASMDFHASGKMIMFPWAWTKEKILASDYSFFDKLTTDMAIKNNYKHGQISKVIYVAKGSSVDYYYHKNGGIALGIELTTSKAPNLKKLDGIINEASEMTWKFLESI